MARPDERRVRQRANAALGAASLASGVLAYLIFAICTRALGAHAAASVSVLWTFWGFATAGLTFPVQHWVARTRAASGGGAAVRAALPRIGLMLLVVSVAFAGVLIALREPLFHHGGVEFPVLATLLVATSAAVGLSRGNLSAEDRFGAVAASIALENGSRAVFVGLLWAVGVDSPVPYGLALVAGNAVGLLWPKALLPPDDRPAASEAEDVTALRFIVGTSAGQLLSQVVLTGGTLLLALRHGSPADVTALFAAMSVLRAPYVVALGLVSPLTGRLSALAEAGDVRAIRRFRQQVVVASLVLGAVAATGAALLLPPIVRAVFGADVHIGSGPSAVLAAASVLAVANLVLVVLDIVDGAPGTTIACWVAGMLAAVPVIVAVGSPMMSTAAAFLVAEIVAWFALLLAGGRPHRSASRAAATTQP